MTLRRDFVEFDVDVDACLQIESQGDEGGNDANEGRLEERSRYTKRRVPHVCMRKVSSVGEGKRRDTNLTRYDMADFCCL